MSLEEYKEKVEKYGELKQLPIEVLPYIVSLPRETSGFWGGLGSSLTNLGNNVWSGISNLGQSAWGGITWTGDQISDFANWATNFSNSPNKAIENGANQAKSASDVSELPEIKTTEDLIQEMESPSNLFDLAEKQPETVVNAAEQQGVWDTVGNIARDVGTSFMNLVGKVGVPLGTTWLTMEMKKDMMEEQMEQGRGRQQARQHASNNLEEEKKKRINQTVSYLVKHRQKLKQLGYNIKGNDQLKNRMALEILKKTHGKVPSADTPITKFFAPKQNNQITINREGRGGGDVMSWLSENWYIPVSAIGLLILLLGLKE